MRFEHVIAPLDLRQFSGTLAQRPVCGSEIDPSYFRFGSVLPGRPAGKLSSEQWHRPVLTRFQLYLGLLVSADGRGERRLGGAYRAIARLRRGDPPAAKLTAVPSEDRTQHKSARPVSTGNQLRGRFRIQAARNGITFTPAARASTRSARYCSALFRSAASSMWL